jgi:formylglycine-generating enzyme required for sulfatase activity
MRRPAMLAHRFIQHTGQIAISAVTLAELYAGAYKRQIDKLMNQFPDAEREVFDAERPQHPVKITRPFYLAAHQVTVGQFRRFVQHTGYKTEAEQGGEGSHVWDGKD